MGHCLYVVFSTMRFWGTPFSLLLGKPTLSVTCHNMSQSFFFPMLQQPGSRLLWCPSCSTGDAACGVPEPSDKRVPFKIRYVRITHMFDGGMITQWIFRAEPFFDKPTFKHHLNRFPSLFFNFDVSVSGFFEAMCDFFALAVKLRSPKWPRCLSLLDWQVLRLKQSAALPVDALDGTGLPRSWPESKGAEWHEVQT